MSCPYSPRVQSHAWSTSVRTLKIPSTDSHTIVWTHGNAAYTEWNGYSAALGSAVLNCLVRWPEFTASDNEVFKRENSTGYWYGLGWWLARAVGLAEYPIFEGVQTLKLSYELCFSVECSHRGLSWSRYFWMCFQCGMTLICDGVFVWNVAIKTVLMTLIFDDVSVWDVAKKTVLMTLIFDDVSVWNVAIKSLDDCNLWQCFSVE